MPIPKYEGGPVDDFISDCMKSIGGEYDQEQALAICYAQTEEKMSGINLGAVEGKTKTKEVTPDEHYVHHGATSDKAKEAVKPKGIGADENLAEINIPLDIIGDNEVKILEYLPEPTAHEMEDTYLNRCVPLLYPKYYDQTVATALCADKLQRKTTVTNLKAIKKIMKQEKMSAFERNKLDFLVRFTEAKLRGDGILLADYPWEDCIADQIKQYGDPDIAAAVCGKIKAESGGGAKTEKGK
jgi:hypothetical protein